MPSHFDRFRLLNDGDRYRIKNESYKPIHIREHEEDDPVVVPPGGELPLPESPEVIIDVEDQYL